MRTICYLYYSLYNYFYEEDSLPVFVTISAYIATIGIIWVNILSMLFLISTIFLHGKSLLDIVFTSNSFYNKFIVTPILLLPIFLIVLFIIKTHYKQFITSIENEEDYRKKRNRKYIIIYITGSIIVLLLSIASPLLIN